MSEFAAKDFLDQATQSLQSGQPQQALEFAQNAIGLEPENADAFVLKGIAESQLNRPREAVDSFENAIRLAPQSAKAYFNFAVHYFGAGEKKSALELARKAVEFDPSHAGARELCQRLEAELGVPPAPTPVSEVGMAPPAAQGYARPMDQGYRPGYEQPLHSVRFVESWGRTWDVVGWLLIAINVAILASFIIFWGPAFMDYMRQAAAAGQAGRQAPQPNFGPIYNLFQVLSLLNWGCMVGWIIVDIIDRRQNWLWMIPWVVCCCCGLQSIVSAIYVLVSRAKK